MSRSMKPTREHQASGRGGWTTHPQRGLIAVAAQFDGAGIGRIRMSRIHRYGTVATQSTRFLAESLSRAAAGHQQMDISLSSASLWGYSHERLIQRRDGSGWQHESFSALVFTGRCLSSCEGCWELTKGPFLCVTLVTYLGDFTFRFNRRISVSRGKLFYRLAQQAVQIGPTIFSDIVKPQDMGLPESRK